MSSSKEYILSELTERDAKNAYLDELFDIFAHASERVTQQQDSTPQPDKQNDDSDIVEKLKQSRQAIETELKLTQRQLDEEQKKSRARQEEDYLRTHVVQDLHNEIVALTMQLNLSEEKRKKLQNELGR